MAFHIIQAQHSSPVIVVAAFVFLLHASAQLVLDHLKVDEDAHYWPFGIRTQHSGNKALFFLFFPCTLWTLRIWQTRIQMRLTLCIYKYGSPIDPAVEQVLLFARSASHAHIYNQGLTDTQKVTVRFLVEGKEWRKQATRSYSNENGQRHPD